MTKFCVYNWDDGPNKKKSYGYTEYYQKAEIVRDQLNSHSPTLCMAKWLQVSINLTNGSTQSCYHPPPHPVPLEELAIDISALHNTNYKKNERKQMLEGKRPEGCAYCWRVEDAGDGNHLSDRHYRSAEWWARPNIDRVVENGWENSITPNYVEVNFNRTCNFKCMYCSPHLSSTWEEEVKQYGPYKLHNFIHNDISNLERKGFMPIESSTKDNPYVQAFWEWWPDIYYDLRVFRMTGGEPLMDRNTFRVLDYVADNPHSLLELSITSNMCPTDQRLFNRFLDKVKQIEKIKLHTKNPKLHGDFEKEFQYLDKSFKRFWLYVSLDSVGKQAEYIRYGLNYDVMLDNIRRFLSETNFTTVSFINTFNLLSIPNLKGFLQLILDLRQEFGGRNQEEKEIEIDSKYINLKSKLVGKKYRLKKEQRIYFDIPILDYPNWFNPKNATPDLVKELKSALEFMRQNEQSSNYLDTFEGFKPHEILKLERNIDIIEQGLDQTQVTTNKKQFYEYIEQYDFRKQTDFLETFPTLANYYYSCKRLAGK